MSTQLHQILAYLDREGVTELVIATGRPVAMRQKGTYVNLTARPLTMAMLNVLVEGTPIAALVPRSDESPEPAEVELGERRLRVRTGRRGQEVVVRLEQVGIAETVTSTQPTVRMSRARTASPHPATKPEAAHGKADGHAHGKPEAPGKPEPPAHPSRRGKRTDFDLPLDYDLDELPAEELTLEGPADVFAPAKGTRAVTEPIALPLATPPMGIAIEPARTASAKVPPAAFAKLVAAARAAKASDLHIAAHRVTSVRTNSDLAPLDPAAPPLTSEVVDGMLLPLLAPDQQARLAAVGYVDLAIDAPGGGRLRANISRHQLGLKGTFRLAVDRPRTLDELGLPKDLAKVVAHHQGFVVIAGPSGHGKTTTLAALVDLINSSKPYHILTVEDPIEIEHPRKLALVSQREAGRHTKNFASALKASLREDPDVIVIGELRDRETVEIALTASETGHLVLATMSTPSAAKTLDRLIDMFPPEEHTQVRASIAGALRAIVAQRLLPVIGGGFVPAIELVTGVLPLAALIRDDKLYQLPNLMQRGRAFGMIRFDESLLDLWKAGKITEDTALAFAESKKDLVGRLKK